MNIDKYETTLELAGVPMPAIIEYEIDGSGPEGILIGSVTLKRCVAQRGDVVYHPDGSFHKVTFPEYITLEITNFLRGSSIKALAEEINAALVEENWNDVMNEPARIEYNFPANYPGVQL